MRVFPSIRLMIPGGRFFVVAAVCVVLASSMSQAQNQSLPFTVVISGDANVPTFRVTNDSPRASGIQLTRIEITIGNVDRHFHLGHSSGNFDRGQGDRVDTAVIPNLRIGPGSSHGFSLDLDHDHRDTGEDYRRVLFNNGAHAESKVTVTGTASSGPVTGQLTMPDGAADLSQYTFTTAGRPRALTITSVTEAGGTDFVRSVNVTVNNTAVDQKNIGETVTLSVVDGDTVEITAPPVVYRDRARNDITDLSANDILLRAAERFTAIGISVNDETQTGDPTLLRFDVRRDTVVVVKWQHDYALTIKHNFNDTESKNRTETGKPWAGPLNSEAEGHPDPSVKKHWRRKGETVVAQIDGQVPDFSRPGLDIRYVPIGYEAQGLPNLTAPSKTFQVGQSPPQRQQVPEFTMNGPVDIEYQWRIQFGVKVNVDDASRATLPKVFQNRADGSREVIGDLEGTFWFDPGASVTVAAAAHVDGPNSQALNGWINGDGYYFSASGDVNPAANGNLLQGGPTSKDGKTVATWLPQFTHDGRTYRGLHIPQLQRSVRVLWRYGNDAIEATATIGQFVFQNDPQRASIFITAPDQIVQQTVTGTNAMVGDDEMAIWDPAAAKLYPLVPGRFQATWRPNDSAQPVDVLVTVQYPDPAHYPHIADTPPVALDPDPADNWIFKELKYSENEAVVDDDKRFSASMPGKSVLLFADIQSRGRGQPQEFLQVRVVYTRQWDDPDVLHMGTATIGRKITDKGLDGANLETGYVRGRGQKARYNPFIYDVSKLDGLAAKDVYEMTQLRATSRQKNVVHKENLPGPIIPVNLHPGATQEQRLVVVWYDDPTANDELLWPHQVKVYTPQWPTGDALGQIVIASQDGSDSRGGSGQEIVPALNGFPAEITYNPSRLQNVLVYSQPDPDRPGYNPNEEHGLVAPSRHFADVSPRPLAIYALRDNDLNAYTASSSTEVGQDPTTYTSHPFVLVQFFDVADNESKMKVYRVVKEVSGPTGYRFAQSRLITPGDSGTVSTSPRDLLAEPHVTMEAGEPVIPFYPLGHVIGASPCAETIGTNLKSQEVYWEDDVKASSWAISGGDQAWFTASFFYPLLSDFWWPDKPGRISVNAKVVAPQTGDCVAFLPADIKKLLDAPEKADQTDALREANQPTPILYKSDWPKVAPTLKAGETLTFSGGEFRTDHPTIQIRGDNDGLQTLATPGLPGIIAFASAQVVFDALNPTAESDGWKDRWTARVAQVLERRSVVLPIGKFPSELQPATGKTRVEQGTYLFNDLPASLQKRVRYNPLAQSQNKNGLTVSGQLELIGVVNDRTLGDRTLTAAPPAVFIVEPNILTEADKKALQNLSDASDWDQAVEALFQLSRNPDRIRDSNSAVIVNDYLVGLEREIKRDTHEKPIPLSDTDIAAGFERDEKTPAPFRGLGPGLALIPNQAFLDPTEDLADISWITVAENNDPSLGGGSPITLHVIKVDRTERYRGAIKTVLSDNVFDENIVLRHTGDFGTHADALVFEWWYRPDDGSLNVAPPDLLRPGQRNPWKLFPDPSGQQGRGRFEITLKGNPNAPEALLADTFWFVRYRHTHDKTEGTNWQVEQPDGSQSVNFTWAGAGNSDPFHDFDNDGLPDFQAQLAQGWIKRVLDAVNPYEARIRQFETDNPSTKSSMIAQLGQRFEGPIALNPDKDVIENVGLIELYETILKRGRDFSIDLSRPVSTPAIANALQLASTRLSDFYVLLGNEAYTDALDPTIGFGSDSVAFGSLAPAVFAFQNQMSSLIQEELALLRGVDDFFARPVYNRLFWNFTKGEGESAYAQTYNISDINQDGFIDERDALELYPQGHGDTWGHYLTALRKQYDLLKHPHFNWVSRSEFYNLLDIVLKVDFLDERKFAQTAAAKAKVGAEIVNSTYRNRYVEDPTAQWQGYTDALKDRAWGVQGWARRAGQGAYFDWVMANALLPAVHPNDSLDGIQKVDRTNNADIAVISANLNAIQKTFDQANSGQNPLGLAGNVVSFDIDPARTVPGRIKTAATHFEQLYERTVQALQNAVAVWDHANQTRNMLRQTANSERDFRNQVFQEDLAFRNRLIKIFGRPYDGTIGPGKLYPPGYSGPDTMLFMYVDVREITQDTVPGPTASFADFDENGALKPGGDIYKAFENGIGGRSIKTVGNDIRHLFAPTFAEPANGPILGLAQDGWYAVTYTDLANPKVPLVNLSQQMPVTAAGYTFQAPQDWGARLAVGELQTLINKMLQQEAKIARAIGAWDALTGEIGRTFRLVNAQLKTAKDIRARTEAFMKSKRGILGAIGALETALDIAEAATDTTVEFSEATKALIPKNLPTAGLAFSPGDALSGAVGAIQFVKASTFTGLTVAENVLKGVKRLAEIALEIAESEVDVANADDQSAQNKRELLKELEDLLGDEPVLRIEVFRQIQALRELSDRYRSRLDEGARLIDERIAFNQRVAAQTQRQRYQDMTFRVSRNHALQTYRAAFDLAARYAYLAAKAYDYETNLDPAAPGSPVAIIGDIVRARGLGQVSGGEPQLGKGGLAEALTWLKANYDVLKGQLSFNNPQIETGKLSLRRERFRILPKGGTQPDDNQFPRPGSNSDNLWRATLANARVDDLWQVPEFRHFCRPFAAASDANGKHVPQPGLVLRFSTEITPGHNFFGRPLSGADHAYDPSNFATKIRSVGVWFSDYLSDHVLNHLAEAPRIYLVPVGVDVMRVPSAESPNVVRVWNVVDERIPVPLPSRTADLDNGNWIPLLDSLSGRMGEPRQYSSFRAYHNGSDVVSADELISDNRLIGRSIWNTQWVLIIPGLTLNADPNLGLERFIQQVSDIKLVFQTYGYTGN